MYQHRTIHVLGDENSDLAVLEQLVGYADALDSEVSLLCHINSRILQFRNPDENAVIVAENRSEKVSGYLHRHDIKTGAHELTVQNLVDGCALFADTRGADCISMSVTEKSGKLTGAKKTIANRSERNVLLMREGGAIPPEMIICPVDGSPASSKGLRQALMLANIWDAKLRIVSVLGTPRLYASPNFGLDYPINYPEIEAHLEREKVVIGEFIDRHLPDENAAEIEYLHTTFASEGVCIYGADYKDALLVVGVAARDRFASAVLGNTAYKIAVNAANSTLLVRNNSY